MEQIESADGVEPSSPPQRIEAMLAEIIRGVL